MNIQFHVKNWLPSVKNSERILTVTVPVQLDPTEKKVIDWLKNQQPYLIEGEKWEVVKTENSK